MIQQKGERTMNAEAAKALIENFQPRKSALFPMRQAEGLLLKYCREIEKFDGRGA